MRPVGIGIFILSTLVLSVCPAHATIIISEFLADPPSGVAGDANGDGITSSSGDEFVELYNPDLQPADLSGWSLHDAISSRHVFANGTFLGTKAFAVIFGAGTMPAGKTNWFTASSGQLSLNNTGDTISLLNTQGTLIDSVQYGSEGGKDQSLARSPLLPTGTFYLHTSLPQSNSLLYSPGFSLEEISHEPTPTPTAAVPEMPNLLLWIAAGAFFIVVQLIKTYGCCPRLE